MAYGGLRGAVCYGLAMSLNSTIVGAKDMFATTTIIGWFSGVDKLEKSIRATYIIVILFTVFVQVSQLMKLFRGGRVSFVQEGWVFVTNKLR